jgi:predicted nucleotidyltransferase
LKKYEIIMEKITRKYLVLKDKYKIKTLALFGSYVRGAQKRKSDVDILVEFEKPIGLFKFMALERELSAIIGKKVDLVMKTALKPRIGEHILREAIYIYEKT